MWLFCFALCCFRSPSWRWWDAVGIKCKKGSTTENQGAGVENMGYGVCVDDCVCVICLEMTNPPW